MKSAIRSALEKSPKGLLNFLKKCSPGEYREQVQRATEEENAREQERKGKEEEERKHRAEKTWENDRIRQQRCRQKKYGIEISHGNRSPGGTKRKVIASLSG